MSIGDTGWCDSLWNGHYLAYPYTDDNLGYIDGYCGWTKCNCRAEQPVMNEINNAGGMGFIAHPHVPDNSPYYGFDWDDWSLTGFTGLEIISGGHTDDDLITRNNPGGEDDSWREFLESETNPNDGFVVGIASSDAHHTEDINQTFTYCYLDSLITSNMRNAIKDGNCVASTGPFVQFTLDGAIIGESVNVPDGTNTLSISASSTSEFGDLEWIFIFIDDTWEDIVSLSGTSYSDSIDVSLDTSDDYIRLEVYTDTGRRAYTNPIWINVTACSCGSWSVGSCGAGSCNSEQKQWTRSCTPSACAAETQCVYDEDCEEEEEGGGSGSSCTESGYLQCYEHTYGDCDVKIAANWYENVPNNIQWGAVNDAWDPYVIDEYKIGWKGVDAEQMYYDCDGDNDCYDGGCDCDEIADESTMVTITAPGTAHSEEILGYDDTASYWCWASFNPFYPNYENNPYIYVLNCFDDGDCSASKYCDKSSSWSNWDCVNDESNGQSCIRDAQCSSGYCDDDGVGLGDDNICFTPVSTYFQDESGTNYCEISTDYGASNCDERQVGEDLNLCIGTSYYEEECSNTCSNTDITSIFECTDAGCSCSEFLCDGLTTGNNITTCSSGQTYLADKCTSTAGGEDRGDNICRNSTFASGCTADADCGGVVVGTGWCNASCFNTQSPDITSLTETPSDPATYSSGASYEFNATVIDGTGIDTVLLEFNGVNYTASAIGDVYNVSLVDLGVGSYNYRWYADDAGGNVNNSETGSYVINTEGKV